VHLARGRSAAFASAVAFPNDGRAIRMNGDPDPGEVDRQECAPIFAGNDATGLNCLTAPTIKPEDPIGLRDRILALDIGKLATMGLAGEGSTASFWRSS
jgi:hypothetical protein